MKPRKTLSIPQILPNRQLTLLHIRRKLTPSARGAEFYHTNSVKQTVFGSYLTLRTQPVYPRGRSSLARSLSVVCTTNEVLTWCMDITDIVQGG